MRVRRIEEVEYNIYVLIHNDLKIILSLCLRLLMHKNQYYEEIFTISCNLCFIIMYIEMGI